MEERYLSIMIQSLEKKISVLDRIIEANEIQKELFKSDDRSNQEELDKSVHLKSDLIDELIGLDDGFQNLYDKVKAELEANPTAYGSQVERLQELIRQITDRSVRIEAQESQNKALASRYFSGAHKSVNQKRATVNAANVYRKNMKKISVVGPQFMDKKK